MNFLLYLLSAGAVLSTILVISAKNPVISVLFLISLFLNVAGYLVLIGVAYLGLVYIIVYVGAIAILFLFVVMMLNLRVVELLDTGKSYTQNLPLATLMGGVFFVEMISIIPASFAITDLTHLLYNKINSMILGLDSNIVSENSILSSQQVHVHNAFNYADLSFAPLQQIESIGIGLYTSLTL
jgi:NADH-ubiquinone oxidoreductase chain 6